MHNWSYVSAQVRRIACHVTCLYLKMVTIKNAKLVIRFCSAKENCMLCYMPIFEDG